ncbi:hypothetical protein LSAT2_012324 [Lamellibrachia satsuma]|nr:hypothetical protein LSAT2_012324 [Lamellibrachia satsuma]
MTSVNYSVSLPVSFCHHVSMLLMLVGGLVSLRVGDTKQGFTPILTNSAPAVVGSNVTFYTVLYNCNETSANLSHFTYVWTHNAQIRLQRQRTVGGCSSQISLQFSSSHPGLYTMSVKVCDNWMGAWTSTLYDNEEWTGLWDSTLCLNETPVGLGATIFNLTDALNGNLALRQNNPVIHTPHVYLTNTTISIGVDITDQITNVNFLYTWRVNGSVLATTLVPSYCHTFHAADWYTVEALVNMSSNGTYRVNSTRYGVFGKHIQLKDAVSHLVYSGNRSFPVGSLLHANISWDGSNQRQHIVLVDVSDTQVFPYQSVPGSVIICAHSGSSFIRRQCPIQQSHFSLTSSSVG